MACLDMYNKEQYQNFCSPRISFSNDFVDTQRIINHERRSSEQQQPPSSDFEFSVTNYNMMAADELFSKGRLLPYKDNGNSNSNFTSKLQKMTLRDELLTDHNEDTSSISSSSGNGSSSRPPKNPIRWKELLGLKRNSKKPNKSISDGEKTSGSSSSSALENKNLDEQEVNQNEGGFSFGNVDA